MTGRGDLAAVQGSYLGWQGQREFASAGQGRRRVEIFRIDVRGAEQEGGEYAPTTRYVSQIDGLVRCDFGIAFPDPPMMKAAVALKHHDMNNPELEENQPELYDPDYQPVIHAATMNWRRAEKHRLFAGADVRFTIHDHPWLAKMIVTLRFAGPAIATPIPDLEWVDTTERTP